jgi:hypothetical protein
MTDESEEIRKRWQDAMDNYEREHREKPKPVDYEAERLERATEGFDNVFNNGLWRLMC